MQWIARLIFAGLLLCGELCAETAAPSWTVSEMLKVKTLKDVRLSPDNRSAIFVVTDSGLADGKDSYLSKLYKVALNGSQNPIPFTQAESSAIQPKWSPDGRWIAFLSDRTGALNLYLIRPDGGEAMALTQAKSNIHTFQWSPDSRRIAFVMPDALANSSDGGTSDAIVYQQDDSVNRLWLVEVAAPLSLRALTPDGYFVRGCGDFGTANEEFDWSPDGKSIIFAYAPAAGFDNFYRHSSLAGLDIETGKIIPWEKLSQHESLPRYSPNGKWVAYLSSDTPASYAIQRQVAVRAADGTQFRLLAQTFNAGPFMAGPSLLGWHPAGEQVLLFEPKGTKFQLLWLPLNGGPAKEIVVGGGLIQSPVLSDDGTMLGMSVQTPSSPPEAHVASLADFKPKPISSLNSPFKTYPNACTEVVSWRSTDGQSIEGLLTYPVGYQPGRRYPLLLVIHGGPMGFFNESFLGSPGVYPLAALAEAGFAILRPNPRGSCGYGKAFRCANYGDWGGKDYQDIMSGVDAVIARGIADGDRLGVMGWSYGGYMSAWIVTQTARFKAASIGAAVTNLTSMSGTSDMHGMLEDYMGHFSTEAERYRERSPIYYADKVTTPCLIQHGLDDERVPVTQAYELYHAMNRQKQVATLVLYPHSGHGIKQSKQLIDAAERNLSWFKEHLSSGSSIQ